MANKEQEKAFRYRIVVEWSDEDEAYVARVPAFEGCSAHGDTPGEAADEARTAAEGMLEVLAEDGKKAPPEDIAADYSGQMRLRIPSTLHRDLAQQASAEGVSLNTLLVTQLSKHCEPSTEPDRSTLLWATWKEFESFWANAERAPADEERLGHRYSFGAHIGEGGHFGEGGERVSPRLVFVGAALELLQAAGVLGPPRTEHAEPRGPARRDRK